MPCPGRYAFRRTWFAPSSPKMPVSACKRLARACNQLHYLLIANVKSRCQQLSSGAELLQRCRKLCSPALRGVWAERLTRAAAPARCPLTGAWVLRSVRHSSHAPGRRDSAGACLTPASLRRVRPHACCCPRVAWTILVQAPRLHPPLLRGPDRRGQGLFLSSAQVVGQVEDVGCPGNSILLQEGCTWRRAAARLTAARPGGICSGLNLHEQHSALKKQAVDHTPRAAAPAPFSCVQVCAAHDLTNALNLLSS